MTATGDQRLLRLASRLAPPRVRTCLIERSLVLRSLEVARNGRLTQLIGPPGAGKTTALAQWREALLARGIKVAWLTVTEREREPAAFLFLLVHAVHSAGVDMTATGLLDTLDAEPERALDAILLTLEVAQVDLVLMVDAFERAETPAINAIIQGLVETAPDQVHVALTARRKPLLAVSALHAQGSVRTLDVGELRFSPKETAQFLDLPVDSADLELIVERTEGWPVAVELFRLWRKHSGDRDAVSVLFSGRSEEIADYLTEQVFGTLDAEHQSLLIDLSSFGEVEPALADHVRGRSDSAALLESLTVALPGLIERSTAVADHTRYRIHPLLIDYARGRAEVSSGLIHELRRRAVAWFESARRYPEAICHAQALPDDAVLTRLLADLLPLHIFLGAGAGELRTILRGLSPDQIALHPRLRLMAALAHVKSGFFLEGRAMLEAVRADTNGFAEDPHGHTAALQVEGRALELLFGAYIDGSEIDDAPLIAAIKAGAPDDPLMWAWCENITIVLLELRGELAASREALARSQAVYHSSGMTRFAEFSLRNHSALLALAHGRWREAAELAVTMRRLRLGELASGVPVLAMARIGAAVSDYERRFVEDAAEAVREGLELFGEAETWFEPYAVAHAVMTEVAFRRGGVEELNRWVEQAGSRVKTLGVRYVYEHMAALRAAWLVRAGRLDLAEAAIIEVEAVRAAAIRPPWRLSDAISTAVALWRLARGERASALAEAEALVETGERGGRARTLIKGRILQALAMDEPSDAQKAMEAALAAAASETSIAVFAEEGAAIEDLVRTVAEDEAASALPRRCAEAVLRALALGRRQVNALSEREAQIVAYLREGASNKLIARRLGLTENTIKFHMKRIFTKLGITSRRDAIAAAARLTAGPAAPPH